MNKIYLWEKDKAPYFNAEYGQDAPNIIPFIINDGKKRGCIIICPGGAYHHKAMEHEGYDVARVLNSKGVNAFVLDYRVKPYGYPAIPGDIARAVRYVRFHADEFGILDNKIGVLGFSSGGHLATTTLCNFDYGLSDGDDVDKVSSRPDAAAICYGVISLVEDYSHFTSRDVLFGGMDNEEELAYRFSAEKSVKDDCPPCFLWHTQDDDGVSVMNSLNLYLTLTKKNIPSALHVFPHGAHGLGLAPDHNDVSAWSDLLGTWLKNLGFSL